MNSLFSFIFLLLLFETNSNGNFEWSFRLKQIHGAADRGPKNASNQNKKIAYNVSETKALADIFRKKIQNLKANSEVRRSSETNFFNYFNNCCFFFLFFFN